jgi:hypothetical protein
MRCWWLRGVVGVVGVVGCGFKFKSFSEGSRRLAEKCCAKNKAMDAIVFIEPLLL